MKRYHHLLIFLTIFVYGCASENDSDAQVENAQSVEVESDSSSFEAISEPIIEMNEHLQLILDKSDTTYALPIQIDTNFVNAIDFEDKSDQTALSFENGHYLAQGLLESPPTANGEYNIKIFCELDSLKSVGAYEDYVNNLDIGMMKVADAFVEGIVKLDDQSQILIWSINYSTYEACPFWSGATVYGTLIENNEVENTMVMAEVSSGGDPPAWGDTSIFTEISMEKEIDTYMISRSGEGEGPADIMDENYATRIGEDGFELDDDY